MKTSVCTWRPLYVPISLLLAVHYIYTWWNFSIWKISTNKHKWPQKLSIVFVPQNRTGHLYTNEHVLAAFVFCSTIFKKFKHWTVLSRQYEWRLHFKEMSWIASMSIVNHIHWVMSRIATWATYGFLISGKDIQPTHLFSYCYSSFHPYHHL